MSGVPLTSQFTLCVNSETLWMLMAEALRRNDLPLFARAAVRFKRHVEIATDHIYGGVFRGMQVTSNSYLLDADCKVKWAQDEVLIGCCVMVANGQHLPSDLVAWATSKFTTMRAYVDEKFRQPLATRELPYVLVGGDRKVTFQERYVNAGQPGATSRKEHYHHPRSLMLMLELLQKDTIGKQGSVLV